MSVALSFSSQAFATCAPDGTIMGANGPLTLGQGGCTTTSTSATMQSGATITTGSGGVGITAPGSTAWTITLQGNTGITADGDGILVTSSGSQIQNGGIILSINANGIESTQTLILNNTNIIASMNGNGALLLGGSSVTNGANATIEGGLNGLEFTPGSSASSVDNAGHIRDTGLTGDGIDMDGVGGVVINRINSSISGPTVGIDFSASLLPSALPSMVLNSGAISSDGVGIIFNAGGTLTNFLNGSIIAQTTGVSFLNAAGFVSNSGSIISTNGAAISMNDGGSVINTSTGMITNSLEGVVIGGGAGAVNNAGTIQSTGILPAILLQSAFSSVANSGSITGNVQFLASHDVFIMTAGKLVGNLLMGPLGNETAIFQGVKDTNIDTIGLFNGGGGGQDQLTFNNSQYTGGSKIINWETVNIINGSNLTLNSNLVLGGLSADKTATLNINAATLTAANVFNPIIQTNSSLPVLVNNAGLIAIISPAANNSLIIRGNYVGIGGGLLLNTILNSDNSASDKLVIDGINGGGSAQGLTSITIHRIAGVGAQTNANGILVVQAINAATSTPGAFILNGPVRAGAFDYRLFRGGVNPFDPSTAQDWFLRSVFMPIPPTPFSPTTSAITNRVVLPILGPEISVYGSALPTAMNIGRNTLGTLHERVGEEDSLLREDSGTRYFNGAWARTFGESYSQNYSSIANPQSRGTLKGAEAGLDIYRNRTLSGGLNMAGFYGAYANADPHINGLITNPAATAFINTRVGNINLNSETAGLYWTHFWHSGTYVDLVGQAMLYQGHANSMRTSLSLQGHGASASAELGYAITLAPKWSLEPQTQLIYQYSRFNNQSDFFAPVNLGSSNGLLGRIGGRLKYTSLGSRYLVQPYIRANLWSTLSGNTSNTNFENIDHINTSAKNSWIQLGGGITVSLSDRVKLYSYADGLINVSSGQHNYHGVDGGIGLRVNI